MNRIAILITAILGGLVLPGCWEVNVRSATPPEYVAPSTLTDTRTNEQLTRENAELRARLAQGEKDRRQWQNAVDCREQELDQLQRQRDQAKKTRDFYKDAVED